MQESLFLDENIPPEANQGRGAKLGQYANRYNKELKNFLGKSTVPNTRAVRLAESYIKSISKRLSGKIATIFTLTPRIEAAKNILGTKRRVNIKPWSNPSGNA